MFSAKALWANVWRRVLAPEVDPGRVEARVREARSALPPPVIWLLGKTQSGKTSLVHALTGSSRAEIGNGFALVPARPGCIRFPTRRNAFSVFWTHGGSARSAAIRSTRSLNWNRRPTC